MRVQVYWNITKKVWSVRDKATGLVCCRLPSLVLTDCKFVVQEGGRQRVLREKQKNIHAFVEGELDCMGGTGDACKGIWGWDKEHGGTEVTYNPYKYTTFVQRENKVPIHTAPRAILSTSGDVPVVHICDPAQGRESGLRNNKPNLTKGEQRCGLRCTASGILAVSWNAGRTPSPSTSTAPCTKCPVGGCPPVAHCTNELERSKRMKQFNYNKPKKLPGRDLWLSVRYEYDEQAGTGKVDAFVATVQDRLNVVVFTHREPCVNCDHVMASPGAAYPKGLKCDLGAWRRAREKALEWARLQPRNDKTKVVIVVSGGVVQDVYASSPEVEVELLDFDNAEAEGSTESAQERAEEAERTMHHIF